jgi:SWI/SNF-related matrix-associated actin-dependent regulator 1 of chromatin subfamily A
VQRALLQAGIPSLSSELLLIGLDHADRARHVLEAKGYQTASVVPLSVLAHVCKLNKNPTDIDISGATEPLWSKLKDFQRVAVKLAVQKERVFIGDAMGSGKTIEAIATCWYFRFLWPVLIFCPAILKNTWANELRKWLGAATKIQIVHSGQCQKSDADFVLVSYSLSYKKSLESLLLGHQVVILDESHYIKNLHSRRGVAALKYASGARVRLLMSGTPFSYPSELYPQIHALYPDLYPEFAGDKIQETRQARKHQGVSIAKAQRDQAASEHRAQQGLQTFVERYCGPERSGVNWVWKGYTNQEELHAVLNTFAIRRRKEDLLPFLPSKTRTCVVLGAFLDEEYAKIASVAETKSDSFMDAFRMTCRFKIPHVVEYLRRVLLVDLRSDSSSCALVFVHHTAMREAVEELLNSASVPFFSIFGGVSDAKRAKFEKQFQSGGVFRVGVLSMQAACAGLTLTKARRVVFTELLFSPEIMFQAEDRVHRIGQECPVDVVYLIAPKTTDDINWGLIKKKEHESTLILDGQRHLVQCAREAAPRADCKVVSSRMVAKRSKIALSA